MKVRNTHCLDITLSPADLAKALGHEHATVREITLTANDGHVKEVRVVLDYVIATKGIRRTLRTGTPDPCESMP